MTTSLEAADNVIKALAGCSLDYSAKRTEIADLFEEYLWNGNWEMSTDFEDETPNLLFVQEDEYDQHRENGSDEPLCLAEGHYILVE